MIWKSEVHDENINDFSLHPPTCIKRCYCKWQGGSNSSGEILHITLLWDYTSTKWSSMFV